MKIKKENSGKANTPKGLKQQTVQFKVKQEAELMKFLEESLPHKNRNNIKTMLKKRQVVVNGTAISQFNHVLKPGDSVELSRRPAEAALKMPGVVIVHEDEHVIVVNKNAGLLTIATDKEKRDTVYSMLSSYVKTQDKSNKIFIVHRLDRETSGLMLFAKSKA